MSHPTKRGVTLLEVTIAMAILGSIFALIAESLRTGSDLSGSIQGAIEADNLGHRMVSTMVNELRSAKTENGSLDEVDWSATSIEFEVCTGLDASGLPEYGESRRWQLVDGRLEKVYDPGTANERTEVLARNLPANSTVFLWDDSDDCFTVALNTSYEDANGNAILRRSTGRVYLRTGLAAPDGKYGEVMVGGVTTGAGSTGGTPADGTPVDGTPVDGTPIDQTPQVKVIPALWISLVRSGNGSNQVLAGDVGATANGDSISSLVFTEDLDHWGNTNRATGVGSASAEMEISMTSMHNKGVTVTLTAETASGGTATTTKTATASSGISYRE